MSKVLSLQAALQQRQLQRHNGKTLAFTNGVFDLLHVGHLDYLEKARALADALYVGLNSDSSTQRLKGPARPIVPEAERARLLAALRPVDAVIIFPEDTAVTLLEQLQPDIYVKGGDYAHKTLPERASVEQYGGTIHLIAYLPDHSSTGLIAKIQALPQNRG